MNDTELTDAERYALAKWAVAFYRPDDLYAAIERIVAARVAAAHADALAPARRIDRHAIAAAIYSGGGAVHPDASDRVLALLRAAVAVPEPEEGQ